MSQLDWQKSSFSGDQANCVEIRTGAAGLVELRESDDGGIVLPANPAAFADLLNAIKTGELDHHA
ncbi:DUF397 domain-containing protein [Kitasatospora sp. NPDC057965]|uniref:DUF397 domain-containing protein n=1 Tax=Kitasatospora sp. NPDC057965 TaxID=3346291 RepID=UPI0036DB6135